MVMVDEQPTSRLTDQTGLLWSLLISCH